MRSNFPERVALELHSLAGMPLSLRPCLKDGHIPTRSTNKHLSAQARKTASEARAAEDDQAVASVAEVAADCGAENIVGVAGAFDGG